MSVNVESPGKSSAAGDKVTLYAPPVTPSPLSLKDCGSFMANARSEQVEKLLIGIKNKDSCSFGLDQALVIMNALVNLNKEVYEKITSNFTTKMNIILNMLQCSLALSKTRFLPVQQSGVQTKIIC